MAKQTGLIQFTGKLGNVIGYRRNGACYLRSLPEKVRQTTATRQASRNFGIASSKGKLIRQAIVPHLDIFPGGSMGNCLNKTLIQAGKDLHSLEGFQFNRHCNVEKFFFSQPVILPGGIIQIPAQPLPEQEAGSILEIKAIAVRVCFVTRKITARRTATITADTGVPFPGATMELTVPGKGLLMLVLQVRMFKAGAASFDRRFMAADIVGVLVNTPKRKKPVKTEKMPVSGKIPAGCLQNITGYHLSPVNRPSVALYQLE
ncbi:hypothetical protein [Chitinophaga sp. OAE865]|uniref:hypothetical protein n=1 Tax=Chitinophaga sp. OAE865 TaxID=2817898 RepID=UPI001AE51376